MAGLQPAFNPQTPPNRPAQLNPDYSLTRTQISRTHYQRAQGGATNWDRQLAPHTSDDLDSLWNYVENDTRARAKGFHDVFGAAAALSELGQTDEVIRIIGGSTGQAPGTARRALMRFSLSGKTETESGADLNVDWAVCVKVNGREVYHRFNLFLQAKCMKPTQKAILSTTAPENHQPVNQWSANWSYVSQQERLRAQQNGGPARDQAALLALHAEVHIDDFQDARDKPGKGHKGTFDDPYHHFGSAFLIYTPLGSYIVPVQLLALFVRRHGIPPQPGTEHDVLLSHHFWTAASNLHCHHITRYMLFPQLLEGLVDNPAQLGSSTSQTYLENWTRTAATSPSPPSRSPVLFADQSFIRERYPGHSPEAYQAYFSSPVGEVPAAPRPRHAQLPHMEPPMDWQPQHGYGPGGSHQ